MILGVDVGGTFTDAVLRADDRIHTAKVASTDPQSDGAIAAAREAIRRAGKDPRKVERFVHGMTVATNALLERRGARVVFVTTEGFRDVLGIGRQSREELYTLYPRRTATLVDRSDCLTVRERVGPEGVVESLEDEALDRLVEEVAALEPEAVAVCLLWSFAHPEHEERIDQALSRRMPEAFVVRSSAVAPVFREFERAETTVVEAYVTPLIRGYLDRLTAGCREAGLPRPEIMLSSGGTADAERARDHGAGLLLSGPAGGVVAARSMARSLDIPKILTFDMGGTSTDCAAVTVEETIGGLARGLARGLETSTERRVAGRSVRLPMVDIHTVSAGGGSIAWLDAGGALKVGPRSAGARPGPACYGLGGEEPTVTDVNLVLGRLHSKTPFGGTLVLREEAARRAVQGLAREAGLGLEETAEGVLRIAVFNMAAALRKVSLQRGLDPRGYALMAFGGAGGLHACDLADEIGAGEVIVPVRAGVFSAVGLAVAPQRAGAGATVLLDLATVDPDDWRRLWRRLEGQAGDRLSRPVTRVRREIEARYAGQSFELAFQLAEGEGPHEAAEAFHGLHADRYGYADRATEVELVLARAVAFAHAEAGPVGEGTPGIEQVGESVTWWRGEPRAAPVWKIIVEYAACAGGAADGPALFTADEFSIFLPAGWRAVPGPGCLRLRRIKEAAGGTANG